MRSKILTTDVLFLRDEFYKLTEMQRDVFLDLVDPQPESSPVKAKASKPATKKLKQCDICGISKRAAHHRDVNHPDYHEFDAGGQAGTGKKSKRALELAEKLPKPLGQGVKADEYEDSGTDPGDRCTDCIYIFSHNVHHLPSTEGYHEFKPPVAVAASGD